MAKLPIRDINEPDLRDILLASLQKGNLQAVAFERDGGAVRMFVEAAPQYKTVNLYNSELKRVPKEELLHSISKGTEKDVKLGEKQETGKAARQKNGNAVEKQAPAKAKAAKRSMGH